MTKEEFNKEYKKQCGVIIDRYAYFDDENNIRIGVDGENALKRIYDDLIKHVKNQ